MSQYLCLDKVLMCHCTQRVQKNVIDEEEESVPDVSLAAAAQHEDKIGGVNAKLDLDASNDFGASKRLHIPTAGETNTRLDEEIKKGKEVQERDDGGERGEGVKREEMLSKNKEKAKKPAVSSENLELPNDAAQVQKSNPVCLWMFFVSREFGCGVSGVSASRSLSLARLLSRCRSFSFFLFVFSFFVNA